MPTTFDQKENLKELIEESWRVRSCRRIGKVQGSDYISADYKTWLTQLQMLPFMYFLEMSGIPFLIN